MVMVVIVVESSKNERMEHCKGGESKECKEKKRTGRTIVVSKKEKKDNWKDYSREYNNFKNPIYGSDTILQKAKQSEYKRP